jgi:inner membrane protein
MVWWAWVILGIACFALEVHLTQDFSLFCVGVGAFAIGAFDAFGPDLPGLTQWLMFAALSVIVLFALRKPLLGRFQPHRGKDADFHYLVGELATPDEDLPVNGAGHAEMRGSIWSARNGAPIDLHKGQRCRVEKVEGLTLWLRAE